jgi:hypothetical protein
MDYGFVVDSSAAGLWQTEPGRAETLQGHRRGSARLPYRAASQPPDGWLR